MTLKETIETLQALHDGEPTESVTARRASILLGIEALKFKQAIRAHTVDDFDALLPGETES